MAMTAIGRYPVFLPVPNPKTSHTHQRSCSPSAHLISQCLQGPGHTARTIRVVGGFRDLSDHLNQIPDGQGLPTSTWLCLNRQKSASKSREAYVISMG